MISVCNGFRWHENVKFKWREHLKTEIHPSNSIENIKTDKKKTNMINWKEMSKFMGNFIDRERACECKREMWKSPNVKCDKKRPHFELTAFMFRAPPTQYSYVWLSTPSNEQYYGVALICANVILQKWYVFHRENSNVHHTLLVYHSELYTECECVWPKVINHKPPFCRIWQ